MKILLINNNPVVSRLTALSARKEDVEIDEIQEVTELNSDIYDIVFVDADSLTKDVRDVISENIRTRKSVLFYSDGDEEEKASFDLTILKPFLPSEVSAVIRSLEEYVELEEDELEEDNFNIIDDAKSSKREELFKLDGLDDFEEPKKTKEKEEKGVLSLTDSSDLEEEYDFKNNGLDKELFDDKSKFDLDISEEIISKELEIKEGVVGKKTDDELFDLDLIDDIPALEDEPFPMNKKEEPKDKIEEIGLASDELELVNKFENKEKDNDIVLPKVEDEPLELEEVEKVVAVEKVDVPKKETQILDEIEIAKIKGILTEETSDELVLEELMTPVASTMLLDDTSRSEADKGKEKPEFKEKDIHDEAIVQTLASMPVESLRELLAGAVVKIKIKFPKSK